MDGSSAPGQQINLQTLVAAIQNAVQAQNLIATNIKTLNTTLAAAFPPALMGSKTWDPPSVSSGASTTTTVSVVGAVLGNFVQAAFSLSLQGLSLEGYVSAADTVTVVLSNLTGSPVDLASGTLAVQVAA